MSINRKLFSKVCSDTVPIALNNKGNNQVYTCKDDKYSMLLTIFQTSFFFGQAPPPASPTVDARPLFYAVMISFIQEDFIYYTDYIFPF